jgi:hypothetical protein
MGYYDDHLLEAELKMSARDFAARARGWVKAFHRGVLVAMPLEVAARGQFESADEALRALAIVGDADAGNDDARPGAGPGSRLKSFLQVFTPGRRRG